MNDPELEQVREWLARDPIRSSDAPTKAGWLAIERRITRRRRMRTIGIGAGLLAAAAALVLLVGRPGMPRPVYLHATADLEAVLQDRRSRLAPETVRALERSLTVIDSALAQAEEVLAADPANDYVVRSIDQLRNRRLATLRDGVALAALDQE